MSIPRTPPDALARRRQALLDRLDTPALLSAGSLVSRNYPAATYPFRAASHFLYLVGQSVPGAALLLRDGQATLYAPPPDPEDELWLGPRPSLDELGAAAGLAPAQPIEELPTALEAIDQPVATLATQDTKSAAQLSRWLGRAIEPGSAVRIPDGTIDAALSDAIIALRLVHDEAGLAQIRAAADATVRGFRAAMAATRTASTEAEVHAAMLQSLLADQMGLSFGPIVSVRGEILHNEDHSGAIAPGDLLLADVGGETPEGWAADITRVWPVSGRFSPSQRDVYQVVLGAQLAAIDRAKPGVRYREVHEAAKRATVEGLRDLGVFRGEVDGLLERGAAAIFFPHGIGHLMGLDVHDMEDLGDRAGYAPGRARSERFGDAYLRLDRDLEPGMVVTIEPGFYQVPAILRDEAYTGAVGGDLDREALGRLADVRGIRIEDDILITPEGNEVLTAGAPKEPAAVEAAVSGTAARTS
ncbi:MAG: aminopeptidase P family protein [Deltaproteobacteria bacterium]|jgi:Xaa-Pro aminopeptidase|nr:aminopeptidase P family protein [Deltaproteobacteria bacterium]MBW2532492.1 aminopeptidase P family protein [Deltaproteobacteria bacterium]